jgi:sugar lactone lactonase YvrE
MALLAPCLFNGSESEPVRAMMTPTMVRLQPGEQQSFKVSLLPTWKGKAKVPGKVTWWVGNVAGGNTQVGTIDDKGLYMAPAQAPKVSEIHVKAQVDGVANRDLWATVIVGNSPTYKIVNSWSEPTEGSRFKTPHGLSLDHSGNLLIADQGAGRIFRYTKDGKLLSEIGLGPGLEPGHFTEPRIARVDADGNIFVLDVKWDEPRLQMFDSEGRFVRTFAEKGTRPGDILRGHGLGFDKQQRIYVNDVDNARVNIYDHSGKYLSCWGRGGTYPGEFSLPHGLVMDSNDDIFINGFFGPIQKFTSDGHFLLAFGYPDPADKAVVFHGLAGDQWGSVYVTVSEAEKGLLLKYNNTGDFVTQLKMSSTANEPSWAAVDEDGKVYVLYTTKGKAGIEVFSEQ